MQWTHVINDPSLQDLPYKVELNEWGQITLSPASNRHGLLQAELSVTLTRMKQEGKIITECSIQTHKGVKVADIAWGSDRFFEQNRFDTPYLEAPEVCIEIVSPSNTERANTEREMEEKISLYLSKGAKEVWLCDEDGHLRFFSHRGTVENSKLFPTAPTQVNI